MSDVKMLSLFEAARRVSVPVVVVRTADQYATMEAIVAAQEEYPLFQWDAVRGMLPINESSEKAATKRGVAFADTVGFADALTAALALPPKSVLFAHNAQRQLTSSEPQGIAANVQAVANVRPHFEQDFRMLVMLAPDIVLPSELEHDVVIIDHELPGPDVLGKLVADIYEAVNSRIDDPAAQLPAPTPELTAKATDAVSGLSLFEARQVTAMSMTQAGLDVPALWERKRVAIEQVRGLSVYRGAELFRDIVGLDAAKAHLRRRMGARIPVGVVVVIDEGSDVFANAEHETSGVKMDQQRALLTDMENNGWPGVIYTGVSGGGKSLLGKAFGNEVGVPTVMLDFGDMEGPHVGESEMMLRQAMRAIKAIGRGHAFFILTCNSLAGIRPQFQRRFRKGVYFFDVLTPEQRAAMWAHYIRQYELPTQPLPDDDAWMGAEIRECCLEAWDTGCTLVEAALQILPVARSRGAEIEAMRKEAHGRFKDANKFGDYTYEPAQMKRQLRAIELPATVIGDPRTLMPGAKES